MHDTLPRLEAIPFPAIRRARLTTLQVNLGYRCNQSCLHCHVNAGPNRTEAMAPAMIDLVPQVLDRRRIATLDITGGAPELHPELRRLVAAARDLGVKVMDRCNLNILSEPGQEDTAAFLAENEVEVVASMPCYLADNVDRQRGNLVFNPQGPSLPPGQKALEADYKRVLRDEHGIVFDELFVLANMPIQRFGSTLISKAQFDDYMALLRGAHRPENLPGVMCRSLVSVDFEGFLHDCDFNQMLKLPLVGAGGRAAHLRDLLDEELDGRPIRVAGHCYGCTAGQGSSCGGALKEAAE